MLAMARALSSDPALLLLDELSMGLAPLIVDELYETVGQIAQSGVSILVVEQFARTALKVCRLRGSHDRRPHRGHRRTRRDQRDHGRRGSGRCRMTRGRGKNEKTLYDKTLVGRARSMSRRAKRTAASLLAFGLLAGGTARRSACRAAAAHALDAYGGFSTTATATPIKLEIFEPVIPIPTGAAGGVRPLLHPGARWLRPGDDGSCLGLVARRGDR